MNTNRKRNVLTRQKLLTILDKTEETVKLGISIKYVLPFFKQYKLKLRVLCFWKNDLQTRYRNEK